MKEKSVIKNEDGSVLILSLVILALLLVIGISATTTSNIENLVTRNVEDYTVALYEAEAAAMVAAQKLENAAPNPLTARPAWLKQDAVNENNILDDNFWSADGADAGIGDADHLAGSNGIVEGSSLDMGKSNVYGYSAYGLGKGPQGGKVVIGVGYRRAF